MANKTMYQIVGRYMDGKEVTGYHLQSLDKDKSGRYTKEQVYFLVGRNQITNCTGQLFNDKVLLRGEGIKLESLPIQKEDGTVVNTDSVGKVRRGASTEDIMSQLQIQAAIVDGKNTIGYILVNAGGGTTKVNRNTVLTMAKAGKIGNARYQESNGKPILRGVEINLNDIPVYSAEELGMKAAK